MGDFVVTRSDGELVGHQGPKCRYSIRDGVLTVFDGKGGRYQYSASGWSELFDREAKDLDETEGLPGGLGQVIQTCPQAPSGM